MRPFLAVFFTITAIGFVTGQQGKKTAPKSASKPPKATPAESLKIAKGFKAELLFAVPQEQFGSWVNLCHDPKGRLIVSDQYGALWRVTPPGINGSDAMKIEAIPANIGEAQGLLWAFDSLYVVINSNSKNRRSGLYRVTDSNNDDKLDSVVMLRELQGGGGEHGPHAVIMHPDGKRLTVVCGNQSKMVNYTSTRVPPLWGEDHLLPRMPDGRNFMAGVLGPGGCIYNVTPDGKEWELFSTGFRNPYDAAYDRNGNLFTYDADMEWDFNTPWYRPTRVCEVTSGSEFGWRNGAGKYPPYYADSIPAILDVGPGSPTGVCFGHDANFPPKYQDALFICDWSYGKLFAVHLTPKGSTHSAELEEFVAGTPLPLTDVIINPVDRAMYFLVGGRKTQSALYKVTHAEVSERTIAAIAPTPGRKLRSELEAFHGVKDPKAIEVAWPTLNHEDRFLRAAARIAIEHQPPAGWIEKGFVETDPQRVITAMLALTRASASCPQHRRIDIPTALGQRILKKLNSIEFDRLTVEQRLELIRVYHITFNRFGNPDEKSRNVVLAKFEAHFPTGHRFVDSEMAQVLVYLESPTAASRVVAALLAAPTQEEQIEYARALRVLRSGWTPALRLQYFGWIQKSEAYRGGNSFGGFLQQIKDGAVATLTPQERTQYIAFIDSKINLKRTVPASRPHVKEYKLDDLLPIVEKGVARSRNFERGRQMFAAANCASCHRFDSEGGISGPDLTQAAGRFSVKDLLVSILDPNKEISDQYAAVEIETEDGKKIIGRIVNHNGDGMTVNTDLLDPSATISVRRNNVASIRNHAQSMMPTGSLDTLQVDEILDLMAYLLSRGDRNHTMFKK